MARHRRADDLNGAVVWPEVHQLPVDPETATLVCV